RRLALDRDGAAVRLDDRFHQAQAEAEAAFGTASIAAKQPNPDSRQFGWSDADAGVGHLQQGPRAVGDDRHADVAAWRRVLDGVVEQIGGDLFETHAIADDGDRTVDADVEHD